MTPDFKVLRLEALERSFGSLAVLSDINLTIERGEFVALLGPSGCGKSTTLNCIAGLLPVTGGGIWLDGRRIDRLSPERRGFGMVFQNYALFPHLNVERNVGFGLKMRRVANAEAEQRVAEAIALVRLEDQTGKYPAQLSGGQQQRVAIARAIVTEPPIVLMDEPLSNLDANLRIEMRGEIRRIHQSLGSTTIYVTHDQEEALSLADRIVVLRDGRIRQVGTPSELYEAPQHLDVADFMGYRTRLVGKVVGAKGDRVLIDTCGTELSVRSASPLSEGETAVIAARAEDLTASRDAKVKLSVQVETSEYRGHGYIANGKTGDGQTVTFSSRQPVALGETISVAPNESHIISFPQSESA